MKGVPPEHLAELYFNRYPQEVDPVWLNPCVDKRHREIWNPGKKCSDFPSLLVVGPQKTGSTALYTFLKLHPNVSANLDSPTSYEELQFFGSPNYNKGIDWYRSFFPSGRAVKFEKSATYFDKEAVPMQAGALLPSAKVIIILLDPITRAFSWYHHQRAHNDHAALSHSFYDVITNTDKHNREVQSLKTHLLRPGFYYEHIQRWRRYYPDSQIMYVDGEQLTSDPAQVMTDVQLFLNTDVLIDYRHILSFEDEKGFYCIKRSVGRPKCLGAGKGRVRQYGQVDEKSRAYLQQVFYTPNLALKHLLAQVGSPIPSWLAANS
ncbi:NDST4 [Bugula neritina]|uniref:NDST4 n=1 Tax=Bugula neritina TaxID=10212 RepID=A0A7J7KP50_BUGNE|nr:NDST4 [Bugula neritina]